MANIVLNDSIKGVYFNNTPPTEIKGIYFNGKLVWTLKTADGYTIMFKDAMTNLSESYSTDADGHLTSYPLPPVLISNPYGNEFQGWYEVPYTYEEPYTFINWMQDESNQEIDIANHTFSQDTTLAAGWNYTGGEITAKFISNYLSSAQYLDVDHIKLRFILGTLRLKIILTIGQLQVTLAGLGDTPIQIPVEMLNSSIEVSLSEMLDVGSISSLLGADVEVNVQLQGDLLYEELDTMIGMINGYFDNNYSDFSNSDQTLDPDQAFVIFQIGNDFEEKRHKGGAIGFYNEDFGDRYQHPASSSWYENWYFYTNSIVGVSIPNEGSDMFWVVSGANPDTPDEPLQTEFNSVAELQAYTRKHVGDLKGYSVGIQKYLWIVASSAGYYVLYDGSYDTPGTGYLRCYSTSKDSVSNQLLNCDLGDMVYVEGQMSIYHDVVEMTQVNAEYYDENYYPEVLLTDDIYYIENLKDIPEELCIPVTVELPYEEDTQILRQSKFIIYGKDSDNITLYPNEGVNITTLYQKIMAEVHNNQLFYAVGYLIEKQVADEDGNIDFYNKMIVTELLDADKNPVLGK